MAVMRAAAVSAWSGAAVVAVLLIHAADAFVVNTAAVGAGSRAGTYPSWAQTRLAGPALRSSSDARRARQGSCNLGMKMEVGPGSYVALVTPMTLDGMIDEEALRGLLRWHVDSGTDGIVALGTTGEASVLSTAERQLVLDITVEEVGGKVPVVAGTSSVNPHVVIEQSEQAAERGADAVLVVTPAYVKPSQQGLVKFYSMVADQGALPVVLYNVPGRTAVDMGTAAIAELAKNPRIVGLKDATGDLSRIGELKAACPEGFLFYSGDDATGMEYCLGGGNGLISVTADVAPQEMSELVQACRSGDREVAESINNKVIQLHSKLFVQGNPVTVKYALARMGRLTDMLRVPLVPMEGQYRDEVDRALESAGLLLPQQSGL
ncbi:dihydrodipicolinate synthase [Ectocarpus siliculosus]|uniref:4-hydroxy-tetrahydrodipicolinate synthase n=1 Tax=Ectocarpus siliculosus TaxID=2880 RepID=D7FWT1_ECTSI|nr:dihydrodipicolinate synthase [Ectocarpus siliculosus]|eukprot:CBJ32169.1 dihydrodipicolinate synthase [Ectocarpus siliculosus]